MSSATEIKASDVQRLRQTTGAGLMDCKRALAEAAGDFEKAIKLLREKGIAKSSKRADRVAGEGLVDVWISDDQKEGILLELNCETDFVARNDEFIALLKKTIQQVRSNPSWTTAEQIPQDEITALSGKIGEKMQARRFARFKTNQGIVGSYIHAGSKLGVLIQIDSQTPVSSEALKELSRELTLQIAGASPSYIHKGEVPADIVEREKDIVKKQMEGQNKPAEMLEKIAVGKLQQFYSVHCLLDQPYVRDATGKTTIQSVIDGVAKKENTTLTITRFARFRVGAD